MIRLDEQVRGEESETDIQVKKIKTGNLIVLTENKYLHISIGPDYKFTIIAFLLILTLSIGIHVLSNNIALNFYVKIICNLLKVVAPISFLFTALSNPGIYNEYQNLQPKNKYCEQCAVFKPKSVFHCYRCNICVEGYDHHCPWLSKCIGRKNLVLFYIFICTLPTAYFLGGYMLFSYFYYGSAQAQ